MNYKPRSYQKEYNGRWEKPLVNKPFTVADLEKNAKKKQEPPKKKEK